MTITLYSTDCPKCHVLEKKLNTAGVEFIKSNDITSLIEMGFTQVPVLQVNETFMDFKMAVDWIRNKTEN